MQFHTRNVFIAAALVASISGIAIAQQSGGSQETSGATKEMHAMMMKGMKEMQSMRMTGNMDQDFAMMMRHHHQQGVQMAQMELQKGKDPKMREMAQKIMDSQNKEIAEFDEWMKEHRGAKK